MFVTYPGRFRPNICKITRPTAYPTISLLGLILQPSTSGAGKKESSRNRVFLIELHNEDDENPFTFATVTYDLMNSGVIFFPFDDRSPANVVIEEIRDIMAPNGQFDKTSLPYGKVSCTWYIGSRLTFLPVEVTTSTVVS
ncbi:hypothetical protein G5I_08996 [Acromyrmex echinatior]|uniref:Uncharacterized protein n=1 Tax=Acromyrmex echinatior TaxID=103372 RepID=F4WT22_ACREC|nr:hypothetical protein G5I_08996 [Acromyrmex echinatior]